MYPLYSISPIEKAMFTYLFKSTTSYKKNFKYNMTLQKNSITFQSHKKKIAKNFFFILGELVGLPPIIEEA